MTARATVREEAVVVMCQDRVETAVDGEQLRVVAAALLDGKTPYPYQLRVAERLLAGRNMLASAPCGAGKTEAALLPFLFAQRHGIPFADRLIYAVAPDTLFAELVARTRRTVALAGLAERLTVTTQTVNEPDDPLLAGDIIFTTVDVLLRAYVGGAAGPAGGDPNAVGGALIGAFVVVDDVAALPDVRWAAALFDLSRRFARWTRLLLLSSTLVPAAAERFADLAAAELERMTVGEVTAFERRLGTQRQLASVARPLSVEQVMALHQQRSIVALNTVERAQRFFQELCKAWPEKAPIIRLAHPAFLPADRQQLESWVTDTFGEGSTREGILVTTGCIESGANISAQAVHTDVAPVDALVRRAGRCARFAGERGAVLVYAVPEDVAIGEPVDGGWPTLFAAGHALADWAALSAESPAHFGAAAAATFLRVGRGTVDWLARDRLASAHIAALVDEARAGDESAARELLGAADTVALAIHHGPSWLTGDVRLATFAVSRAAAESLLRGLKERGELAWIARQPLASASATGVSIWQPVAMRDLPWTAHALCVPPTAATYHQAIGLEPGRPGRWISSATTRSSAASVAFPEASYGEHVRRTLTEFGRQRGRQRAAMTRLAETFALPAPVFERMLRVVLTLHDVGKLATVDPVGFAAGYALPGAYAASEIVQDLADEALPHNDALAAELARALFTALARQQGALFDALFSFTLSNAARARAAVTLQEESLRLLAFADQPDAATQALVGTWLTNPFTEPDGQALYWFVARQIALAHERG